MDTGSRNSRGYIKRKKARDVRFDEEKVYPDLSKIKEYVYREPTTIADHKFTEKYGVSYHACHRLLTRVLGKTDSATDKELEKAAILLNKNIDGFREVGEGHFPFLDKYVAVVRSGIIVTVLDKKEM